MRIDRGAQANNRTRRNWQRLVQSTATAQIELNPGANNALIGTSTGYGVFVDDTTTYIHNDEIGVLLNPTGGIISTSTSTGLELNLFSTGSLLTVDSTGAVTTLPIGSTGYVLTVSSTSSTLLSWQSTGSSGGGGPFLPLTAGSTVPLSGNLYLSTTASTLIAEGNLNIETRNNNARMFLSIGSISILDADFSGGPGRNMFVLNDTSGLESIDVDGRALLDTSGFTTVDYGGRRLDSATGAQVLDWTGPFSTGDLLVFSTGNGFTRLPIGTNGQVLTVNTGTGLNTSWSTISAGGGSTFIVAPLDTSISTSTSGVSTLVAVRLNSTGALSTTATGLEVLTDSTAAIQLVGNKIGVLTAAGGCIFVGGSGLSLGLNTSILSTTGPGLTFAVENSTTVLAGPSTGAAAQPTFRQLSTADIFGAIGSTQVFPVVSADPTATAGQAWFNSTTSATKVFTFTDGANTITEVPGGTVRASAQANVVQASTTALTLPNTSVTFPAGFLNVADRVVSLYASFTANTAGVANSFTFLVTLGPSTFVLYSTPGISLGGSATFVAQGLIGTQNTGSSGELYVSLAVNGAIAGVGPFTTFSALGITPVNLTSTIPFKLSVSTSTTNATDQAAVRVFDLQVLN